MSHAATSWLASIDPSRIRSDQFRILFFLCDAHAPCGEIVVPERYLVDRTDLTRGELRGHLDLLEACGLVSVSEDRQPHGTFYRVGLKLHRAGDQHGGAQ